MAVRAQCQPGMTHYCRSPVRKAIDVTGITLRGYRDMRHRLGQGILRDIASVVTVGALAA